MGAYMDIQLKLQSPHAWFVVNWSHKYTAY